MLLRRASVEDLGAAGAGTMLCATVEVNLAKRGTAPRCDRVTRVHVGRVDRCKQLANLRVRDVLGGDHAHLVMRINARMRRWRIM